MGAEISEEIHEVDSEIDSMQYKQLSQYICDLNKGNNEKQIEIAKLREIILWLKAGQKNGDQPINVQQQFINIENRFNASIVNGLDLFREKAAEEQTITKQIENKITSGMQMYKAKPVRAENPEEIGQLLYREIAQFLPIKVEQSRKILEWLYDTTEKEKMIEDLKAKVAELEDFNATESATNDIDKMLQNESKVQDLEMQVQEFKKYQFLYANRENEFGKLEKLNEHLVETNSDLRNEIKQLSKRIESLEQIPDPKDLQLKIAKLETENKRASKNLSFLEQETEEQDQINRLNDELFSKEIQTVSMKQTIDDLRDEVKKANEQREADIKNRACYNILKNTHHGLNASFLMWKAYEPPMQMENFDETMSINSASTDGEVFEENIEKKDVKEAKNLLKEIKRAYLEDNEVLKAYKKFGLGNEKPMTRINIFKFFEELMDKKFITDEQDLAAKRIPRNMTEFMLEQLNRQFGLKRIAMKQLSQIIPGLHTLIEEKHAYGTLFCRMLQLFHPDPIPFNLAFYLTKIRMKFNELSEKAEKQQAALERSRGRKKAGQALPESPKAGTSSWKFGQSFSPQVPLSSSHAQAAYMKAEQGGYANLADVLNLCYSIFKDDKVSMEVVLQHLNSENMNENEYILFLICHKMTKSNREPANLFAILDEEQQDSISQETFINGIREHLDLQILPSKLQSLFISLDSLQTGFIEMSSFLESFSLEQFSKKTKSGDYMCGKASFLCALCEVYQEQQKRDATRLRAFFNSRATWQQVQKDEFLDLCRTIDPNISYAKVYRLEKQIPEDANMNADAFTMSIINYGVGKMGLSPFYTEDLDTAINERKEQVDMAVKGGGKRISISRKTSHGNLPGARVIRRTSSASSDDFKALGGK